jgi:hypothetical protein
MTRLGSLYLLIDPIRPNIRPLRHKQITQVHSVPAVAPPMWRLGSVGETHCKSLHLAGEGEGTPPPCTVGVGFGGLVGTCYEVRLRESFGLTRAQRCMSRARGLDVDGVSPRGTARHQTKSHVVPVPCPGSRESTWQHACAVHRGKGEIPEEMSGSLIFRSCRASK